MKYCLFLFYIFLFGCNKKDTTAFDKNRPDKTDSVYFDKMINLEGLPLNQRLDSLKLYLKDFKSKESKERPIYNLLKSKWYRGQDNRDSTLFYFHKMVVNENEIDFKVLKFLEELSIGYQPNTTVAYDKSAKIFEYIKFAEQHKSKFTYKLYREMAEVYYLNNKQKESQRFNELYFKNNPNKNSLHVKETYYSNRFVIAYQMKNVDTMKVCLDKMHEIGKQLKSEDIINKFYVYASQYYFFKKDYKQSLENTKRYFDYSKRKNELSYEHYHNLADAFLNNKECDSAIYYLKNAVPAGIKNHEEINWEDYYGLLAEIYDKKNDYKYASIAKDSLIKHYKATQEKVQNEKLEELKIKYDTEKKDFEIDNLQSTNELNKILIFGGAFLFISTGLFLYMIYKRKLLKVKNEKLAIENKKLNVEQKALQLQLNPHFIYNSIANLQGLISQAEITKSLNYLSSFSKLLRNILELNREDFIPLKDEIASVSNYIKLQQMRFEGLFDFEINLSEDCNTEIVMIPPMLLQPFLENSIEHGFKNIAYKGKIEISFVTINRKLTVLIKDNGIGIKEIKDGNSEKKSLSKIIIQQRLDILFNQKNKESYLEISSIKNENETGVLVKIILPLIED